MPEKQLDLFSASGVSPKRRVQPDAKAPDISPAELDDNSLLAAIPASRLTNGPALVAEAGRRGRARGPGPRRRSRVTSNVLCQGEEGRHSLG